MPTNGTLHDAFLDELRDAYDAEKQVLKALPKMARAATSPDLRSAFESHLEETRGQVDRLEQVFASLDERVRGKHCEGVAGIIEEGKGVMEEEFDDMTMDAALIASAQRVEHYEMAAYGTLVAWAKAMGHTEAVGLLEEILEEEKAADQKLTAIAEGGINQQAADAAHGDEEEGAEDMEDARPTRAARGAGAKGSAAKGAGAKRAGAKGAAKGGRTRASVASRRR
jgi:ferritin-like metal-binding protein YciE